MSRPRQPMSQRRTEVLAAIGAHLVAHGYMPTLREVGRLLGIGGPRVFHHVRALQRDGWLERPPYKRQRSLRLARALVLPPQPVPGGLYCPVLPCSTDSERWEP